GGRGHAKSPMNCNADHGAVGGGGGIRTHGGFTLSRFRGELLRPLGHATGKELYSTPPMRTQPAGQGSEAPWSPVPPPAEPASSPLREKRFEDRCAFGFEHAAVDLGTVGQAPIA